MGLSGGTGLERQNYSSVRGRADPGMSLICLVGLVGLFGATMIQAYREAMFGELKPINDNSLRDDYYERAVLKSDSNRDGVLSDSERNAWYNAMGMNVEDAVNRVPPSTGQLEKYLSEKR